MGGMVVTPGFLAEEARSQHQPSSQHEMCSPVITCKQRVGKIIKQQVKSIFSGADKEVILPFFL
jgi:hypothetical protein